MQYSVEEILGFEKQLQLAVRKLNALREGKLIETDAAVIFKLEEQISALELEISNLKTKLGKAHSLSSSVGWESMQRLVEKIEFDDDKDIGLTYLVNCNRETPKTTFWDSFDDNLSENNSFQYYFITACPTEMPDGFAERMTYEIIEEELNSIEDGIHCVRHADTDRVRIEPLPLKRNTERSKSEFKAYVQKRFEFIDTQDFDSFIKTGVPKLAYKFVSSVFELHERQWKDFIPEYLNWMMETFRSPHPDVPTFILFFVVYIENLHNPEKQTAQQKIILEKLDELRKTKRSTLIDPLKPVPLSDLKAWFINVGRHDPNLVEEIIAMLIKGLKPEEQEMFTKTNSFHMKDIQELQKIVYQVADKR